MRAAVPRQSGWLDEYPCQDNQYKYYGVTLIYGRTVNADSYLLPVIVNFIVRHWEVTQEAFCMPGLIQLLFFDMGNQVSDSDPQWFKISVNNIISQYGR